MKGGHHQVLTAARTILQKELINIKYQPIVSLPDAMITGFTVYPEFQLSAEKQILEQAFPALKPDAMIEQLALQPEFDLLQIKQLLSELRRLPHSVLPDELIFSIRLSAASLSSAKFHHSFSTLCKNYEIPLTRLETQISPSALLNHYQFSQSDLSTLPYCAISIAMPDNYFDILANPFIQTICLEPALTDALPDSVLITKFVRSLNALSQLQNKNMRIKGIHQQEQLHFLRNLESVQCQGTLFGEAVSVHDISQLIENTATPCSTSGGNIIGYKLQR